MNTEVVVLALGIVATYTCIGYVLGVLTVGMRMPRAVLLSMLFWPLMAVVTLRKLLRERRWRRIERSQ